MADPLADNDLCTKGVAVLEDHLGPVEALRFLALISRQPFDYQSWRDQHFAAMTLAQILAKTLHTRSASG
jgi:hypothetical protein